MRRDHDRHCFSWRGYTIKLDYGWFLFLVKSVHRETLWNVNRKAIHGIGRIPIGNIHRYGIVVWKRKVMKLWPRISASPLRNH